MSNKNDSDWSTRSMASSCSSFSSFEEAKNLGYKRHPDGGLHFTDEEFLKQQRGVVWDIVKSIGNNLVEGHDAISITLPVKIFEPRSFLQRITDDWAFSYKYLNKAANTVDNPVERLKNIITFHIAGMHLSGGQMKPFNPILGETFEGFFDDGTQTFLEQSSHHPPVSHWKTVGPDGSYLFYGYGQYVASLGANAVKGLRDGPNTIEFRDGATITFNMPNVYLKGIAFGERVMEFFGTSRFADKKNGIYAEVYFNPGALGFFKSLFVSSKAPADEVKGYIYRFKDSSRKPAENGSPIDPSDAGIEILSEISGSWLVSLLFGKDVYWDITKDLPSFIKPVPKPLPSDSRYREDLVLLSEKRMEESQKKKSELEDKQRYEERLRKSYKKTGNVEFHKKVQKNQGEKIGMRMRLKDGLIEKVEENGPAEKAGIKINDVVVTINNSLRPDDPNEDELLTIKKAFEGAIVNISVLRPPPPSSF